MSADFAREEDQDEAPGGFDAHLEALMAKAMRGEPLTERDLE